MPDRIIYPRKPIAEMDISLFPTLRESWRFSEATLEKINESLVKSIPDTDVSVVVAGSFGRMEASPLSDLDFMILSQHDLGNRQVRIMNALEAVAREFELNLPNPEGVFSTTISIDDMLSKMGSQSDTLDSLAQRMLLLMESRPIYNERVYRSAIDQILSRYLDLVRQDQRKDPLVLLNDLIRYFRSICVNYHFHFWRQQEKWGLRNVKLKHSRMILYAGLLFLVVNSTKRRRDKFDYLLSHIPLTPLEKLAHVFEDNGENSFENVLGKYEVFLRRMYDKNTRDSLRIDYSERYSSPHYVDLKVNADGLKSDLIRFLLSPRREWSDRIIGYLIF
jgi:predicted nucleotidyltransferase